MNLLSTSYQNYDIDVSQIKNMNLLPINEQLIARVVNTLNTHSSSGTDKVRPQDIKIICLFKTSVDASH